MTAPQTVRQRTTLRLFKAARDDYAEGKSIRRIKRDHHMTDGELRDTFPDEFEDETPEPDSEIGGY